MIQLNLKWNRKQNFEYYLVLLYSIWKSIYARALCIRQGNLIDLTYMYYYVNL